MNKYTKITEEDIKTGKIDPDEKCLCVVYDCYEKELKIYKFNNTYEELRGHCQGYMETVSWAFPELPDTFLWVNESGKLKNMPLSYILFDDSIEEVREYLVGNLLFTGKNWNGTDSEPLTWEEAMNVIDVVKENMLSDGTIARSQNEIMPRRMGREL